MPIACCGRAYNFRSGRRTPTTRKVLDKRVIRSKDLVLKETYKLLTEGGISGVSVDEVSRRSY